MTNVRLGHVVATPAALTALTPDGLLTIIQRHAHGDWGELCDGDRAANEAALLDESRLPSADALHDVKVWVITEANRSATTVMLPEAY
jgi:hypothetical protein